MRSLSSSGHPAVAVLRSGRHTTINDTRAGACFLRTRDSVHGAENTTSLGLFAFFLARTRFKGRHALESAVVVFDRFRIRQFDNAFVGEGWQLVVVERVDVAPQQNSVLQSVLIAEIGRAAAHRAGRPLFRYASAWFFHIRFLAARARPRAAGENAI
jgi:hypothetical protein